MTFRAVSLQLVYGCPSSTCPATLKPILFDEGFKLRCLTARFICSPCNRLFISTALRKAAVSVGEMVFWSPIALRSH